ncbi:hypothetical protein, partial [Bradyrhizobium sp. 179]|uniref:hypothetical protein n=1 Tax=Bradyrhizobium sp. 179 TaxID=2782648 RepID=UPI001FF82B9B
HEYRAKRPNTWLLRPTPQVKILLANPEPSTHGPYLTFTPPNRVHGNPAVPLRSLMNSKKKTRSKNAVRKKKTQ